MLAGLTGKVSQAQDIRISGVIFDAATNDPLPFATVRIMEGARGTTADRQGGFTLPAPPGSLTLIAGHIGYSSQEMKINASENVGGLRFFLQRGQIELPEVVVTPSDNPALDIIRRAIEAKVERADRLENYRFSSHSKAVVAIDALTGADISIRTRRGRGSINLPADTSSADSSASVIILETLTDAAWAKPNRYKETIRARKQTAQIPAQANLLLSSFFIVDLSADLLKMTGKNIVGPISEAGLRNYDYTLTGVASLEGERVHRIEIRPASEYDPLFNGTIYIADGSFALAMADLRLNRAALPAFTDSIRIRQHFRLFGEEFWMPADVIVDGGISVTSIIQLRMHFEAFSVLQDYVINDTIDDAFFDRTRIKVLKEADERDSLFWVRNARILERSEEAEAYRIADSLQTVWEENRNTWTIGSAITGHTFSFGDAQWSIPGIMSLYRFNRVDGHVLEFGVSARNALPLLDRAGLSLGYGFASRSWNGELDLTARPSGDLRLSASAFDASYHIERMPERLGNMGTTLSNLLYKYDDKDYHRERGIKTAVSYDFLKLFPLTFRGGLTLFRSQSRNTDWSIFRRSWPARDNPAINDGKIFEIGIQFSFDNRDFIDNAGEITRFGRRNHVPVFSIDFHRADIAESVWDFITGGFMMNGSFELGRLGRTAYRLSAFDSRGKLPRQRLFFMSGSISYLAASWQFRTATPREFGGDRIATLFLEHDFDDQIFRWLHLPLLEGSGFGLRMFAGISWSDMTAETRSLQSVPPGTAKVPFVEAGFGIDRILLLFRLDLAWRLNHYREGSNFFIGFSSPINF